MSGLQDDERLRRQRRRNVAMAVGLVLLVVIFYAISLVKGPAILVRPL